MTVNAIAGQGLRARANASQTRDKQLRRRAKQRQRLPESQRRSKSAGSAKKATPHIELYQKEECPYSHRVRKTLSALGIDFIAHTVPDDNSLKHKQLVEAGGKDQIPYLLDHRTGVYLYEADAIVEYLNHEYRDEQEQSKPASVLKRVNSRLRGRVDQLTWAARQPMERAMDLAGDARDLVSTLRGSVRVFRSAVREAAAGARNRSA